MKKTLLPQCLCLALAGLLHAQTVYFVDFEKGSDEADGRSPATAFRHSPGDPKAEAKAAALKLQPGDTVRLKGGVVYRGRIVWSVRGEAERPITLDGNADGRYGEGPAIIDGSTPITEWRRLASVAEAEGNPLWQKLFYADLPGKLDWKSANLSSAEGLMAVSQRPKPSDPFFQNRTGDFHSSPHPLRSSFPGRILFEEGSRGNSQTPLTGLLRGTPAVIEPVDGGAVRLEFEGEIRIRAVGVESMPAVHFESIEVLADGQRLLRAPFPADAKGLQRFELPASVSLRKLTFRLVGAREGAPGWTRLRRIAAFDEQDRNLLEGDMHLILQDEQVLTSADPKAYDGMTVGIHAGNNFVYYQAVKGFDPASHSLRMEYYDGRLYPQTRYAFYNSVRLIDRPGEYSVVPAADGKTTRITYFPESIREDGQPAEAGISAENVGVELAEAAHVLVRGLKIRRQGGRDANGILIRGGEALRVEACEVSQVAGIGIQSAREAREVTVAGCQVSHCRNRGIFHRDGEKLSSLNNRVSRNGSTAMGHYNVRGGVCADNVVSGHHGNHANGLTFYLGCRDMVIEGNEVYDGNVALTLQQGENLLFRNNIFDGGGNGVAVGIWVETPLRNIRFLHNTIVGAPAESDWQAGVFSNNRGPEELLFLNNIIDGLSGKLPGTYRHNLYTRLGPNQRDGKLGEGELLETDLDKIFVNAKARDYRLRPGSPAIGAGPLLEEAPSGFGGVKRPADRRADLGAHAFRE